MPVQRLLRSFRNAWRGFCFCVVNERNMRIHLVAAAYVLFMSVFFGLSRAEYAVLLLTIGSVIAAEMFNTSVEALTDMKAPQYNAPSRIAKDAAAGGVLVRALFAAGVAVCLFWREDGFVKVFRFFTGAVYRLPLLALSAALSLIFIFVGPAAVRRGLRERLKGKRK